MKKCKKLLPAIIFAVLTLFSALMTVTASAAGEYRVIVEDFDSCLTKDEKAALVQIMQKTADKIKLNVGYCITADLEGMTHQRYSDYRLDENFGYGSDSVMLVMVNSHDKPEYANATDEISTAGAAISRFPTSLIENSIFPRIYNGLDDVNATSVGTPMKDVYKGTSSAQYYQACVQFCRALETYSSFWGKVGSFVAEHIAELLMAIVVAIIIAALAAGGTKSKYKKKKPLSANNYLDRRSIQQKRAVDAFIREYTTSVTVSSSSSSRSGGGGGGHSSGHGGGGGRHR